MFSFYGDDVVLCPMISKADTFDGQIVRFRCTGRKNNIFFCCANECCNLFPCNLYCRFCFRREQAVTFCGLLFFDELSMVAPEIDARDPRTLQRTIRDAERDALRRLGPCA